MLAQREDFSLEESDVAQPWTGLRMPHSNEKHVIANLSKTGCPPSPLSPSPTKTTATRNRFATCTGPRPNET